MSLSVDGVILTGVEIDVALHCDDWQQASPPVVMLCQRAAAAALVAAADPCNNCELSIVLADDAAVRDLNRDWRDRDVPTNVLAFPGDTEATNGQPLLIGDVIVAYGVTCAEATRDGKTLANHLSHLVVHGTLHLLGYDHENDAEAHAMEALETRILGGLGIADPYADGPDMESAASDRDG
jgi:probable rRNA maturation factor